MSGGIEAAADVATGALVAHAVDPGTGHGHGEGGACLDCGTARLGAFCHRCGQSGDVHRTIGAIGHELAHGVFHFEGRIWRTLPMLVLDPGGLTRRYVAGERTRFVSPLAIFLFSVFLMFTVVANLPGWHVGDGAFQGGIPAGLAKARANIDAQRTAEAAELAAMHRQLAEARAAPAPDARAIARLEERIAEREQDSAGLAKAATLLPGPAAGPATPAAAPRNWFEERYRHAKENPSLLLYKLKSSAYKFSWALIPISLPFIWLLFAFRRGVGVYDHAVFATYSLAFMSLMVIVLAVLGAIGVPSAPLVLAGLVIPPVHICRQIKGAYRLSRSGAVWRTAFMLMFATIAASLFVLMLLYLGVAD